MKIQRSVQKTEILEKKVKGLFWGWTTPWCLFMILLKPYVQKSIPWQIDGLYTSAFMFVYENCIQEKGGGQLIERSLKADGNIRKGETIFSL